VLEEKILRENKDSLQLAEHKFTFNLFGISAII